MNVILVSGAVALLLPPQTITTPRQLPLQQLRYNTIPMGDCLLQFANHCTRLDIVESVPLVFSVVMHLRTLEQPN